MKYLFIIVVFFFSCSEKKNEEYEKKLKSLEKNYTITCSSNSSFLFCWKVNKITFLKDSLEYKKALKEIYKQDTNFMKYLLENKTQDNEYNNWIRVKNPCESTFKPEDSITNLNATKIIIDNLLLNKAKDTIIINNYINKVKIEDLRKIMDSDDKSKCYSKYIKKL